MDSPCIGGKFEIGDRVICNIDGKGTKVLGTVEGIAFKHIIFHYIVRLDEIFSGMKSVACQNTLMEKIDG